MKNRDQKLQQIIDWAKQNPDVRAVLLTSSLVNPLAPIDDFSDLDIELVFEDLEPYKHDDNWLSYFGNPIAKMNDDEQAFDGFNAIKMVLYDDFVKIDFKIYQKEKFIELANQANLPYDWDIGYKILLDKDYLTIKLKRPTYTASLIKKPTKNEFEKLNQDFFWDVTYAVKSLARKDFFYAKFIIENILRTEYFIPMIEYYIGLENDWKVTANKHGRLFENYLSPSDWVKIKLTFAGNELQENWSALEIMIQLFCKFSKKIALHLNYNYPEKLAQDISNYFITIRSDSYPKSEDKL